MSTLDVVADILREVAPRALKARQIAELATGRLPTESKTPETVVSRDLALDVKYNGASSRFLRVGRGEFVLKEALPIAFYNDTDEYVAAWTRNLIAAGQLAPGVVDERSIRDLKPADVAGYRQCHFFSGIGIWSRALRDAGWPDDAHVWSGSCPCQPISSAGKRRGFADERHLWPEWFRLIAACRPAVVLSEQVASKDGRAWLDVVFDDLEGAGYACQAYDLPACSVGAPHRRQRLYIVAYARERGCEILSAPWLHDRGQCGHDAPRCGEIDGRVSGAVSDAAVARPHVPQDARADRGDAGEGTEAIEWRTSGGFEPERGRDADETGAVPDAECVVRHEGWTPLAHGRPAVEPDGHGEADGAKRGDVAWSGELGDSGRDGAGEHGGELPGDEAQHEERSTPGDHAPVATGTAYRPGDRIRIVGDPSWGGAVRGFWARDVEWIYCRPTPGHEDGCFRPAECGTQPLVTRVAAELGRTRASRLRGYGNSIVLPLAETFVAAVIDAFADAAKESAARTNVTKETNASVDVAREVA